MPNVTTTTQNVMTRQLFGKLMEPGLNKIFYAYLKEVPEQYTKMYNVKTSTSAYEEDYGIGNFSEWVERDGSEVDSVAYDTINPGLQRMYVHKEFTKGFKLGRVLVDDNKYNVIQKMPADLARKGRLTVEKDAVKPFLKGFPNEVDKYLIYDGQPLFSQSHPLIERPDIVCGNLLTKDMIDGQTDTAFSVKALEAAINLMRETVDENGDIIVLNPVKLVGPPRLENQFKVVLNTTGAVGNNNNDINIMQGALRYEINPYLGANAGGSDTKWYLMADMHEMNFYWRVRPEFAWDKDFDTFIAKYRGYMRYSYGCSDFRGVVGASGDDTY